MMKKVFLLVLIFTAILTSNLFAQNEFDKTIQDEFTRKEFYEPVGNGKNYGVALNPFGVLFDWCSMEFNIWKLDRKGEINIPVEFFQNEYWMKDSDYDFDRFSIGVNYRKFFNENQQGYFLQAGWKYDKYDIDGRGAYAGMSNSGSSNKILFGAGYRMISKFNGMFWSASFSLGRAWGSVKAPDGDDVADPGITYDIDLLKIGFSW